jgi:predicted membrane-bound spermidine synthase
VELFGFRHTLWIAAAGNFTIVVIGGYLGWKQRSFVVVALTEAERSAGPGNLSSLGNSRSRLITWILFTTGFSAMAMEVVWTRAFTPVLKTQVYSFALIVFTYLGATFCGSLWYRRHLKNNSLQPRSELMALLALGAFLPILADDPRVVKMDWLFSIQPAGALIVLAGICPFCAVLGYLTPRLIDEAAGGHPAIAGRAYAVNVLGCILGPLFASYILLPWMSERSALFLLGLPLLLFHLIHGKWLPPARRWGFGLAVGVVLAWALFFSRDFGDLVSSFSNHTEVRRDYAASVTATGEGMTRSLLVNGMGMTRLTPITKFMVHLPLAFHQGPPQSALIICFGMGTTYRSALSWDIDATAVELVPGVAKSFGFYHADAAQCLNNPKGRIVVDDGRRFLMRTREQFDVIVIDPPPPTEAAGSSLLYSTEFYALARQHLKPHGILQAWFPGGELLTEQAILRSIQESFPHVRCFDSIEGWGTHLLASVDPIENLSAAQLAARMPPEAKKDLLEWSPAQDLPGYLGRVVLQETPIKNALNPNREIRITDDHPYNEYFLLREWGLSWR